MKKYTSEFRLKLIKEYEALGNTKSLRYFAHENEVPARTFRSWLRNYNKLFSDNTPRSYRHKFYKPEFKIEAVRCYLLKKDSCNISDICKELGVCRATLKIWIETYRDVVQNNLNLEAEKELEITKKYKKEIIELGVIPLGPAQVVKSNPDWQKSEWYQHAKDEEEKHNSIVKEDKDELENNLTNKPPAWYSLVHPTSDLWGQYKSPSNQKEFEVIKQAIIKLQHDLTILEEAAEILRRTLKLE